MNDTIVVFGRGRENMKAKRGKSLTAVINLKVNQTRSRTFITTGTTLHRHRKRHLLHGVHRLGDCHRLYGPLHDE